MRAMEQILINGYLCALLPCLLGIKATALWGLTGPLTPNLPPTEGTPSSSSKLFFPAVRDGHTQELQIRCQRGQGPAFLAQSHQGARTVTYRQMSAEPSGVRSSAVPMRSKGVNYRVLDCCFDNWSAAYYSTVESYCRSTIIEHWLLLYRGQVLQWRLSRVYT